MQPSHFWDNRQKQVLLTLLFLTLTLGLIATQAQASPTATDCAAQTDIPQAECETLVALYTSTNGPNWITNTGWNVTNSPCSWYGITCNSGNVQTIQLSSNQLSGTIPDLSSLTSLQTLRLSFNQLSGTIPDLSSLTNLQFLSLHTNQLSGSIPNLFTLTSLRNLDLSNNQLSGSIPDLSKLLNLQFLNLDWNQLGNSIPDLSALVNLNSLWLRHNQLSGSIPNLSSLTNLQELYLSNNQLSGSIPDLSTLTSLHGITMNDNQLSGSIPNLSTLTSLQTLILSNNQLSGSIPDLSALTNLQWLILSSNQLSGSIPNLSALTNLSSLGLSDNQLSGSIPSLSTLTNLTEFHAYNNQLNGSIPDLSTLTNLQYLYISDNQLSGSIPDLSTLTNLRSLWLHNNQLSGSIPDLSALTDLINLSLRNNQLSGSVPISVCQVTSNVWLAYNKLEVDTADSCVDSIDPDWKTTQTVPPINVAATAASTTDIQLNWSAIAYTQHGGNYEVWGKIQGSPTYTLMATTTDKTSTSTIVSGLQPSTTYEFVIRTFTPAHDSQQNALTSVDSEVVSATTYTPIDCSFQTQIPVAECETLVALYNSTNGPNWTNNTDWTITNTPCSWYNVRCSNGRVNEIILHENNLSGFIPDLSALTSLQHLYLNNNQLSGSIPDLSTLTSLQTLSLFANQLSGSIPNLSTLTSLQNLSLTNNQLSGTIPNLSMLTNLQRLWLDSNQLSGSIPNLLTLINLQSLDLSDNKLSGSFPDISTLTNLRELSLSNNHISGSMPDLSAHTNLQYISMYRNQLSGSIPDLSTLTGLQDLDLGYNQLNGSVPASVCQASMSLDISHNKLEVNTADSCVDSASPYWKETQTVPPTNVAATISANGIHLTWDAIAYTLGGGFYGIWGQVNGTSTYTLMATTEDKTITNATVSGLQSDTTYDFVIRTFTPASGWQQNDLTSVDSEVVTVVTTSSTAPLHKLYLPLITKPFNFEAVTLNAAPIPNRSAATIGETFYTTTADVGATLPPNGTFYLSSTPNSPAAAAVDDEVAILLNGIELFTYTYGQANAGVQPALVEVPRSVMTQIVGKTITVKFRDVYGNNVSATELYLIWSP